MMTSGVWTKKEQQGNEKNDRMASDSISDASRELPIRHETNFRTIDSRSFDGSVYRGEGNATLVLSLPSEWKVLRFRKSDPDAGDEPAEDEGETRVRLIEDFHGSVISGLFGIYAGKPEAVRCDNDDLRRLMKIVEVDRPEKRRHKRVIETFATLLPDYTFLPRNLDTKVVSHESRPTFCVEIKPKEGTSNDDSSPCDYCKKQNLKMAQGKISSPSKYCPRDLFSGENERMRRAIRGLIDSPQNNFRIFKNGKLVWGEEFDPDEIDGILAEWFFHEETYDRERALDLMFELIREALLRSFHQPDSLSSECTPLPDSTYVPALPRDSVLERLLRVQRRYRCSVDSIYSIYSTHSRTLNDEMIYSRKRSLEKRNLIEERNVPAKSKLSPISEELRALRDYLVYRIARDCSILMAFREIDLSANPDVPRENVVEVSGTYYFLFSSNITDLDPKSVHSIAKHRKAEILKVSRRGQNSEYANPVGMEN